MEKKYFKNLDGLRFILAMIVFCSHSRLGEILIEIIPFDFFDRLVVVFSKGSLAVSFFFTLSGFLITFLILEEKEYSGGFNIKNFYLRRILRIWPLYYAMLSFAFFIYPWIKVQLGYINHNPYNFLYQLLFLSNFDSIAVDQKGLVDVAPMMIGINWSIAIEEQFYLFWPLLFLLTGGKKFWLVIVLVVAVSWYCRTFLFEGPELYYHTLSVISDLGIGALFAYFSFYSGSFIKRVGQMPSLLIAGIYAVGLLGLMYYEVLSIIHVPQRIFNTVFFAFIIVEQNYAQRSFFKFGNNALLTSLGKYTYSLYLLNPVGIQISILVFRRLGLDMDEGFFYGVLYVLIAFTATMLFSILSYRYIEFFFLKYRKRFSY